MHRGLWAVHTFNKGVPGREVDVFLLDERYDRSPLPCYVSTLLWCRCAGDAGATTTCHLYTTRTARMCAVLWLCAQFTVNTQLGD